MARSMLRYVVTTIDQPDSALIAVQNATVLVTRAPPATGSPVMFATDSGGVVIPSGGPLISNEQGEVRAWMDEAESGLFDLTVSDNGGFAYRAGKPNRAVSFPTYVERIVTIGSVPVTGGGGSAISTTLVPVGLITGVNVQLGFDQTDALFRTTARRSQVEHDLVTFGPNTTENTLYTFTIPGTAVGGNEYRMRLWGEVQNASGGDTNLTFRVNAFAQVQAHMGTIIVPHNADFRGWGLEMTQFMDNDFSLNLVVDRLWVGAAVTGGVLQGDNIANRSRWRQQNHIASDWATGVPFDVTVQFSVNGPTIRRHGGDMYETLTVPG